MENNISDRSKDPHLVIWMDGDKKINLSVEWRNWFQEISVKQKKSMRGKNKLKHWIPVYHSKVAKKNLDISTLPMKEPKKFESVPSNPNPTCRSVSIRLTVDNTGIGSVGFIIGSEEDGDNGPNACCLLVLTLLLIIFLMAILWKLNLLVDQYSNF